MVTRHRDPRPARSRAKLLAAATSLLRENGPAAVTVDAVIRSASVARATFYRHFSSTNELVAAAFGNLFPTQPTVAPTGTLRERLTDLTLQHARMFAEVPATSSVLAWLSLGPGLGRWDGTRGTREHADEVQSLREHIAQRYLAPFDEVLSSPEAIATLGDVDRITALALLIGPLAMGPLSTLETFDYEQIAVAAVDGFLAVYAGNSRPQA